MEDAKAARAALRVLTRLSEKQLMELADTLDDDVPASLKLLSLLGAAATEQWPELEESAPGSRPRRVPVSPAKASTPTSPTKRASPAAARQASADGGCAVTVGQLSEDASAPLAPGEVRCDRNSPLGCPFKMGDDNRVEIFRDPVCNAFDELLKGGASVADLAKKHGVPTDPRFSRPEANAAREAALEELASRVRAGESLRLLCHGPPRRCHADSIQRKVLAMAGKPPPPVSTLADRLEAARESAKEASPLRMSKAAPAAPNVSIESGVASPLAASTRTKWRDGATLAQTSPAAPQSPSPRGFSQVAEAAQARKRADEREATREASLAERLAAARQAGRKELGYTT